MKFKEAGGHLWGLQFKHWWGHKYK